MASRWGGSQRGPLLTISVGKTGCSSVGDFLRVILKASGPLPLLQPLWPLFLLLQLPSKGDPLCVLRSVVLGGRLGDGGGWLEVIAGIREMDLFLPFSGPHAFGACCPRGSCGCGSTPFRRPLPQPLSRRFNLCFQNLLSSHSSGRYQDVFVPRLDKIQQE